MEKSLEDKIAKLSAGLNEADSRPGVTAKKKTRGRKPSGSTRTRPENPASESAASAAPTPGPTEPNPNTVEALRKIFGPTGNGLTRAFDVSPLEDEEVDTLANGWALLVDEYAGKFSQHTPWIMAGMSTLMVAGPRVAEYYDKQKDTKQEDVIPTPEEPKISESF